MFSFNQIKVHVILIIIFMLSNSGSSGSLSELDAPVLLASLLMVPVVQRDVGTSHL